MKERIHVHPRPSSSIRAVNWLQDNELVTQFLLFHIHQKLEGTKLSQYSLEKNGKRICFFLQEKGTTPLARVLACPGASYYMLLN